MAEPPAHESDELVVATPERVAFSQETAGLGSRFLAQLIDLWWITLTELLVVLCSLALGRLGAGTTAAVIFGLTAGFAVVLAYFPVFEAWRGATPGKRALRLRIVDARGGPPSTSQALVRNLVRIVDFLPGGYGVGTISVFVSPRHQRLGDWAAGTLVVRERQAVSLEELVRASAAAPREPAPAATPRPGLDPRLRRLVVAYTARRHTLSPGHRARLAEEAAAALRGALPEVVAAHGPLAALDQLADEQAGGR